MGFNLIKQEFCNAVKLQYDWQVYNIPLCMKASLYVGQRHDL